MTLRFCSSLVYIQRVPNQARSRSQIEHANYPPGLTAIGVFLFFGGLMAFLAGITLVWAELPLTRLWILNPDAYRQLAPFGWRAGTVFLFLSAALVAAGIGWLRRSLWGWRLAVAIISIQVLGDFVNVLRGEFLKGGTGVAIAGALLFYLWKRDVRASFKHK